MARSFNGSSDYISLPSDPTNGQTVFSISVRSNAVVADLAGTYNEIFNAAKDSGLYASGLVFYFDGRLNANGLVGTGLPYIAIGTSGTLSGNSIRAFGFANPIPTDGLWHNYVGVYDSTNLGIFYLDGVANTQYSSFLSNDGNYVPQADGSYVCSIGRSADIGGGFFHGNIAEIALWSAVLTAQEAVTLAKGYSPLFVRPANLVAYWPLIGRTSPEIDVVGGFGGTLTGTAAAPHPRTIMPRGSKVKRYRPVVVANIYVYMRPDADQSDGSWLNELGTNVNLYASVDETVASDTDYIQSSTTWGDKVRIRLSDPSTGVAQPLDIRYRASGVSSSATLTGRLYQGASTLIDSWSHTVDTTPTNYTHTLGSTEFALITDFNDLYIEFEYVP